LAIWLDAVAGSKSKMYLKSWSITRSAARSPNEETQANPMVPLGGSVLDPSVLAEQDAKRSRDGLRLALAANLSVYKLSPTSGVASAVPAVGANAAQTGSQTISDVKKSGQQSKPVESKNGGPE